MTYAEKLKDPRWQKRRLELLDKAGWKCSMLAIGACFNTDSRTPPSLHVHHKLYLRGKDPWDYEDWAFDVLCEDCHLREQAMMEAVSIALAKSNHLQSAVLSLMEIQEPQQSETLKNLAEFLALTDGFFPEKLELLNRVLGNGIEVAIERAVQCQTAS